MTTVADSHAAPPAASVEPEPEPCPPRRRRRWPVWPALGALLLAVAAGAWLWSSNASTGAAPVAAGPAATATVERGAIALTQTWDATLDYGTPYSITSPAEGTITRLPGQGETIARGDELYRVDERSVILLYGQVPMYRNLAAGDSGADVEQLETNLAELGYDGFTADDEYTAATAEAVRAWQADLGAEQTGMLARGEVVFVPEVGQVDALRAGVGGVVTPGMPILDLTGADQVVSLETDVDDQELLKVDTAVTVRLPERGEITGAVSATLVAEAAPEGPESDPESVLQVEIAVDEPAPDELVGAPVEVVAAIDERADVLLVPVNALLALAEGGYGLEVVASDGSTSIVAVETGLFANGKVEVGSAEITEGMVVGVAGR